VSTEIRLPIIIDGHNEGEEAVPAVHLGGKRFRLLCSPGLVEGIASGDEIQIDDDAPRGFLILQRSGNVCAWLYFPNAIEPEGPEATAVAQSLTRLGGPLDGGGATFLVLTIPISSGFPAIESVLDSQTQAHPDTFWRYGNVYDADGETPLRWWDTRLG
jgi:hypothetical protein